MFQVNINDRIRKFLKASMSIILNSKHFPDDVRCNLIVTKCLSILLYGLLCVELSIRKVC